MLSLVNKMRDEKESPYKGHCAMKLAQREDHITVIFNDGTVFGEPNSHLSDTLSPFLQQNSVSFEVIANISNTIETIGKAEKANDAVVRVDINIYGPRSFGKELGEELSKRKVYLQRPNFLKRDSVYDNPHFLKLPTIQTQDTSCSIMFPVGSEKVSELDKEEQFKRTIGKVYASLTRGRRLHGLEGDDRLRTQLLP
jgi:SWI/SNF-related matrix-associated actin-dependent regulator of chromatin subfamily A3